MYIKYPSIVQYAKLAIKGRRTNTVNPKTQTLSGGVIKMLKYPNVDRTKNYGNIIQNKWKT